MKNVLNCTIQKHLLTFDYVIYIFLTSMLSNLKSFFFIKKAFGSCNL